MHTRMCGWRFLQRENIKPLWTRSALRIAALALGEEGMAQEMLWLVPDLIAAGASAHELVEILIERRGEIQRTGAT